MGDLTENFSAEEFGCKCGDCHGSGQGIDRGLVQGLQVVRTIYGKPITINSGVRCVSHNQAVGGKSDSEHLDGLAVDISVPDSRARYELLSLLLINFARLGIDGQFIHVGMSDTKPQRVVWVY